MLKLFTVSGAKAEIKRLQDFVDLVESYTADTMDKAIILEYAYTNSIVKVSEKLGIDQDYVRSLICSKGKDELHKKLRSMYMLKTKGTRRKPKDNLSYAEYYEE